MTADTYWAIASDHGFYTGTWLRRADAIAAHVHGRYRWTESDRPKPSGALYPMQRADWQKCRRVGDRVVRVRVVEVADRASVAS